MVKNEFRFAGMRFFMKQRPCVVVFEKDSDIKDIIAYDDVQLASEYLTKCRYQCSDKILSEWTRNTTETAYILYIEDDVENSIRELLKEMLYDEEKDASVRCRL